PVVAAAAGLRAGAAGRATGQPAGRLLVVLRRGGGAGLGVRRAARRLALVARVGARAVDHRAGPAAAVLRPRPATEPERAAGQSARRALGQPAGGAAGTARHLAAARALAGRGIAVAGRWPAGAAVPDPGLDSRNAAVLVAHRVAALGLADRQPGGAALPAAGRCAAAWPRSDHVAGI